jgi:hypothetical protein
MQDDVEIRTTHDRGRGLFAKRVFHVGERIVSFTGTVYTTEELPDEMLAMQVGPNEWLASPGENADDCSNHSCDPNAGFLNGELALFAIRPIAADEEITWDYSTSIGWHGWFLECQCGSSNCRGIVRSWGELADVDRERLTPFALPYLLLSD